MTAPIISCFWLATALIFVGSINRVVIAINNLTAAVNALKDHPES